MGLFATCGQVLKAVYTAARYVIDSFPVAVAQNIRILRCKLLTGEAYRGRSPSKRQWFSGFKVQVLAISDGVPVEFYLHAGREADLMGLRAMAVDLPEGSVLCTDAGYTNLCTDAGYTNYAVEDLFAQATGSQ